MPIKILLCSNRRQSAAADQTAYSKRDFLYLYYLLVANYIKMNKIRKIATFELLKFIFVD